MHYRVPISYICIGADAGLAAGGLSFIKQAGKALVETANPFDNAVIQPTVLAAACFIAPVPALLIASALLEGNNSSLIKLAAVVILAQLPIAALIQIAQEGHISSADAAIAVMATAVLGLVAWNITSP